MQLKHICVTMLLIVCIRDHVQAKAVQQNEVSSNENTGNIRTIRSTLSPKTCQVASDCPAHSQCVAGFCQCVSGWTTWKDDTFCGYEQRSKQTTLILSIFVGGVGTDWFYLARGNAGYIVAGIFKLLMSFGCCWRFYKGEREGCMAYCACFGIILTIGSSIWWLVDWIRIVTSLFPDGNGVPLSA